MTTPPTDQACEVSRSAKACQPFGTSPKSLDTPPYRASGEVSRGLIRPRVRTACWQLKVCILFTWPGCSTTCNDRPSLPGRNQSAPVVNEP